MADLPTWHRGVDEEQPSYLKEMLFSQVNINALLGTLAGAAVLAIPLGLAGAALPLIAFAAGEGIASMFVPSSQTFRNWVDKRHRAQRRAEFLVHLRGQILRLAHDGHENWATYQRIMDRVVSLNDLAKHRKGLIGVMDLERLEDAALDYLSLWLAQLSVGDRLDTLGASQLNKQLYVIEDKLKRKPDDPALRKAKTDLDQLVTRRERLLTRKTSLDAALLALPDAVEEIYHSAISSSTASGDIARRLQEAVDRIQIEQNLDAQLDAELGDMPVAPRASTAVTPGARAAAASSVKH